MGGSYFSAIYGQKLDVMSTVSCRIKYTPQKILRATILFSMYRNVKAPKLFPYLMDFPKDSEYLFHLHYFRYCPKVTVYKTLEKGNAMPKPIEHFWHFSKNHEITAFS